jgi:hypothetical protein
MAGGNCCGSKLLRIQRPNGSPPRAGGEKTEMLRRGGVATGGRTPSGPHAGERSTTFA